MLSLSLFDCLNFPILLQHFSRQTETLPQSCLPSHLRDFVKEIIQRRKTQPGTGSRWRAPFYYKGIVLRLRAPGCERSQRMGTSEGKLIRCPEWDRLRHLVSERKAPEVKEYLPRAFIKIPSLRGTGYCPRAMYLEVNKYRKQNKVWNPLKVKQARVNAVHVK